MANILDIDLNCVSIAPSILSADFAKLGDDIKLMEDSGADLIHIDVMDGHFVPNISFGAPVAKCVRNATELVFDAHLMISEPLKYSKDFANAGCEHITFHVESDDNSEEVIQEIRNLGCTVGISVKPKTPAKDIIKLLPLVDLVLVMTVEPGFGGQSFMEDMMPKIQELKTAIDKLDNKIHLQVDGGISESTVQTAVNAGANMMVAGTAVFKHKDGAKIAIKNLKVK